MCIYDPSSCGATCAVARPQPNGTFFAIYIRGYIVVYICVSLCIYMCICVCVYIILRRVARPTPWRRRSPNGMPTGMYSCIYIHVCLGLTLTRTRP